MRGGPDLGVCAIFAERHRAGRWSRTPALGRWGRPRPRVTAIIPTYNWSTALRYAIHGVLWQTFTDFRRIQGEPDFLERERRAIEAARAAGIPWAVPGMPEAFPHPSLRAGS